MIDIEEAINLALKFIRKKSKAVGYELCLLRDNPVEVHSGWIFYYESKRFLDTKEPLYKAHSALPLVVDKNTGDIEYYTEVYRKRKKGILPKFYDLNFFFKYYISAKSIKGNDDCAACKYYASYVTPVQIRRVTEEARIKLEEVPFDWEQLSLITNRSFQNKEEAKKWLRKIVQCLVDS